MTLTMPLRLSLLIALAAWPAAAAQLVDFSRDVRPILSDRCFSCHGPDEANRKAGMRLDTEEGAKKGRIRKSSTACRARPPRGACRRPIRIANRSLKKKSPPSAPGSSRARNGRGTGASPRRSGPTLPAVRNAAWVRNPIDNFILARLEREDLTPSPEADRARLLRRVTFDLTGLPPTLAELDAFLADRSPDAYEKAVDRLLASPRYGERMAVDWLDAARYADTHGYQTDPAKEMWPWRDWVIQAFNRNMPYDQFTIEQLAGDLLPNATLDQKIATGFQRNHRINSETGSIAEEFQAENLVDRASTVGTVWLGLTVGCARCHDHKYDPIPHRDFYSLYAFFNSVEEVGNGGTADPRGNFKPVMRLPSPELEAQLAAKDAELKAARAKLAALDQRSLAKQAAWEPRRSPISRHGKCSSRKSSEPTTACTLKALPDGSVIAGGAMPPASIYEVTGRHRSCRNITAFRLELIPDASLPGWRLGTRRRAAKASSRCSKRAPRIRKSTSRRITADFKSEESELNLVVRPADQLKRGWGVNPEMNKPHFAVIETARMLERSGEITFRIGSEYEGAPSAAFASP